MEEVQEAKRKVHRSPNYPAVSLNDAIEKAALLYDVEKRTPASPDTILSHWGYKPGVGPALRLLSALRQYGLLEEHGGQLRISDDAFHILNLSEESPERIHALREAAKKPTLIHNVVEHFKDGLPSDVNLRDYLIRTHRFNPDSVATFISVLRETVELAKLYDHSNNQPEVMETQRAEMSHESAVASQAQTAGLPIARTERLIDESGSEITLHFQNEPSAETYEYLRDYLDFKLKRITRKAAQPKVESET